MGSSSKKYKVAEFAGLLGITMKTVYRMIERGELKTCQDIVNNRTITCIIIDEAYLLDIKNKYTKKYSQDNDNVDKYEDIITAHYSVNENKTIDIIDKMQQFYLEVNDRHNGQVKEYIDRLMSAEMKVKLLEDSEKRKEQGYLQQISELKAENEKLKKSKNWKFWENKFHFFKGGY